MEVGRLEPLVAWIGFGVWYGRTICSLVAVEVEEGLADEAVRGGRPGLVPRVEVVGRGAYVVVLPEVPPLPKAQPW